MCHFQFQSSPIKKQLKRTVTQDAIDSVPGVAKITKHDNCAQTNNLIISSKKDGVTEGESSCGILRIPSNLLDLVEGSGADDIPLSNLVDSSFGIRDSFTLVSCKLLLGEFEDEDTDTEGDSDSQWDDNHNRFLFVGKVMTKTRDN